MNELDQLGVWDGYSVHVPQLKDISHDFHLPWAEDLAGVLSRAEEARSDPDPLVLERALKWIFAPH